MCLKFTIMMMILSVLLLICLVAQTAFAFTPDVRSNNAPLKQHKHNNNNRQSSTLDNSITYDNDWHTSLLHPVNDLGVNLDDDMNVMNVDGIIWGGGGGQVSVNSHPYLERRSTHTLGGGPVAEVAISFLPVALLVVLEIIMAQNHHMYRF